MSFLGIAFEMGAVDAGMDKALDAAVGGLDKINDAMSTQVARVTKLAGTKAADMYDKTAKAVDRASDAVSASSDSLVRWGKTFRDDVVEAVDKGTEAVVNFGRKSKGAIDGFVGRMKSGSKKIGGFFDKMKSKADSFNLAHIASKMKDLTGETGNLSNGMESTFVSMLQTTKPIVAQLSLSAKEMKRMNSQAAGMAYSMNTDAGAVAETLKSMKIANEGAKEALDAMNMSTKDWVKVVQTTGIPMSDYTAILGDMTASWDASPKQAGRMIDSLVAIGKQTGTGTLNLKSAKGFLDELDELYQTLPPGMAKTADDIEGLMLSTAKLSGAFVDMGEAPQLAEEMARQTARMFAEQSIMIEKAFKTGGKGAATNTPLIQGLIQIGMSFEEARKVVDLGSKDVALGMQAINEATQKYGPGATDMGMKILQENLGESVKGMTYLATNSNQGAAALAKVTAMAIKGGGALKQYGKDAFSSGLTLQDSYNRAQEAFDTTIRSIARKNVVGLVKNQMAGIREAGKELKELGSDKTWGPWINAMSQYRQMGIGGLFASLSQQTGIGAKNAAKFGAKIGVVFDTMGKLGDDIAPLMQFFGMFGAGGMLAGGVGIAAMFAMSPNDRKEIFGSYAKLFDGVEDKIKGIFEKIDLKKLWPRVKKFLTVMFDMVKKGWKSMMDAGVIQDIGKGLKKAWNWFVGAVDWGGLIDNVGKAIEKAWGWVAKNVDFTAMGERIGSIFSALAPKVWEMLKSAFKKVGDEMGVGGQLAIGAIIAGKIGGGGILGALVSGLPGVASVFGSLFSKAASSGLSGAFSSGSFLLAAGAAGVAIGSALWKEYQRRSVQKGDIQKGIDKSGSSSMGQSLSRGIAIRKAGFEGVNLSGAASGKDLTALKRINDNIKKGIISQSDYASKRDYTRNFTSSGKSMDSSFKRTWELSEKRLSGSKSYNALPYDEMKGIFKRAQQLPSFQKKMQEISQVQQKTFLALRRSGEDEYSAMHQSMSSMAADVRSLALWASSGQGLSEISQYTKEKRAVDVVGIMRNEGLLDSAVSGGGETADAFGDGFFDSMSDGGGYSRMSDGLNAVKRSLGGSLPETGPLADGTAAYHGGYETMIAFSDGVLASAEVVREAVEQTLNDSVIYTMEEYGDKMREIVDKKDLFQGLAKQMVKNLGGKIETDVNANADVNVKKNFQAALSLPGFAGVILAVSNEGAQTRKLLARILSENEKQTALMPGGRVVSAPPVAVVN